MASDYSRRDFIKGGVTAGVLLSGVGIMQGCTENLPSSAEGTQKMVSATTSAEVSVLSTDVLVIGAGVAGMETSISALKNGADVIIVDKKRFGHCGDSGMHYSGAMTSSDLGIDGDNVDVQLEDAVENTVYLVNQTLGRAVLQEYADQMVIQKSENYGNMHHRNSKTGEPTITASNNRPRGWQGWKPTGMAQTAKSLGLKVMDYCIATKLIAGQSGEIAGATVLDFKSGKMYLIRAKSVVVAAGGTNGLYGAGTVSAKHGSGSYTLVGDGFALTAPLGVEFRDLEYRSLVTVGGVVNCGAQNFPYWRYDDYPTYVDANGTAVFASVLEKNGGTISEREILCEYYKAIKEGRVGENGGLFTVALDPNEQNIDEMMLATRPWYQNWLVTLGHNPNVWENCETMWLRHDAMPDQVEVVPSFVYEYGGIVTDERGATGVEGLYAVGECAMHTGAGYCVFRMFSSCMVTGAAAGEDVAQRAKDSAFPPYDGDAVAAECERVYAILHNEPSDGISSIELRHRIQDIAWKGAGALRSDAKCEEALKELDEIEKELEKATVVGKSMVCNMEWAEALELPNMVKAARMIIMACQQRTESRGHHLRADYPEQNNDNWIKNIYLREDNGEIVVDIRETDTSIIAPPTGKVDLGGGVIEL